MKCVRSKVRPKLTKSKGMLSNGFSPLSEYFVMDLGPTNDGCWVGFASPRDWLVAVAWLFLTTWDPLLDSSSFAGKIIGTKKKTPSRFSVKWLDSQVLKEKDDDLWVAVQNHGIASVATTVPRSFFYFTFHLCAAKLIESS